MSKIVLITGAGSGIGAETAFEFAKLNYDLILTDVNENGLNDTKSGCIAKGLASDKIKTSVGDLTNEEFVLTIVDDLIEPLGKLDILVNSAGIMVDGKYDTPLSKFDKQMLINVRSLVHITQVCVPYLIEAKGCIVNLSSLAGTLGMPNKIYYAMSKAAVSSFTKSLALELAGKGVRVNGICPGIIETNIHTNSGYSDEQTKQVHEKQKHVVPLGRSGKAIDVAKSIVFISSEDASFITGEFIRIDGGRAI